MDVVKRILDLDKKKKVLFILQFGSTVDGTETPRSDVDITIFYEGSEKERFRFRLLCSGDLPDRYDVQIYQDLPLYVRNDIVKKHKVLFARDEQKMKEILIDTIRDYSRFEKYLNNYYEGAGLIER
ncbi:MAG: nucleotidyltransferase domain-containing protein [Nanobdellota archaeon]